MFKMIDLYYFSPTGGTRKAAGIFSAAISENICEHDLANRNFQPGAIESGLAVLAAPVFAGRIPALSAERIRQLPGSGKKAVTIAVYGNRAYDDALLELNDAALAAGFDVIASAAVNAQHSVVPEVGLGRPDAQDEFSIKEFAVRVLEKIEANTFAPVRVPGNFPYRESMHVAATPISLPFCIHCGKCAAACPTQAISFKGGILDTQLEKCILCMACTAACPARARILPPPMQQRMDKMLGAFTNIRSENEYFL